MKFVIASTCFTAGAIGGLLSMLALLGLAKTMGMWAFLARPDIAEFYPPMVWGGLCALLYIFPTRMNLATSAILYSVLPAFIHMGIKNQWFFAGALSRFDPQELLSTYTLVYFAVYAVCWGGTTGFIIKSQLKSH